MRSVVSGHFIGGTKGPIFVLRRTAVGKNFGCVLVVPPFGEEMNKCRRMVTETAVVLASHGIATVLPDLFGTGDSGGDFEDADWATWRADLAQVAHWSAGQGCPATALLAIRLGCLLATDVMSDATVPPVERTVFWQPVLDGGRFLTQFLRLRLAAGLTDERGETSAGLRERLGRGLALDVAGYRLSSRLAADLDSARVPELLPHALGTVSWLEVTRDPTGPLAVHVRTLVERTAASGGQVAVARFPGEPFWSSTEIASNRPMMDATVAHLAGRIQAGIAP